MEKKIIKKPIYDYVQVGEEDEEIYIASDGREFDTEQAAQSHEDHLYWKRVDETDIEIPYKVTLVNFDSLEELEIFIVEEDEMISRWEYSSDETQFPGKFIVTKHTEEVFDYDDSYDEYVGCIYSLHDWKQLMIEKINEIK